MDDSARDASRSSIQSLGMFAGIVAGAFIIGVLLPGMAAYFAGVFSEDQIRLLVLKQFPELHFSTTAQYSAFLSTYRHVFLAKHVHLPRATCHFVEAS